MQGPTGSAQKRLFRALSCRTFYGYVDEKTMSYTREVPTRFFPKNFINSENPRRCRPVAGHPTGRPAKMRVIITIADE